MANFSTLQALISKRKYIFKCSDHLGRCNQQQWCFTLMAPGLKLTILMSMFEAELGKKACEITPRIALKQTYQTWKPHLNLHTLNFFKQVSRPLSILSWLLCKVGATCYTEPHPSSSTTQSHNCLHTIILHIPYTPSIFNASISTSTSLMVIGSITNL